MVDLPTCSKETMYGIDLSITLMFLQLVLVLLFGVVLTLSDPLGIGVCPN
jgi:hypothetical protein